MQLLRAESNRSTTEEACARAVLDGVPIVMASIRRQMRGHRSGLTVPQFRTLYFVNSGTGHSLSDVADFIGLSLPAMSRLVDGLVEKRLMLRRTCDSDRRHVRLSLTPLGQQTLSAARGIAQSHMVKLMKTLGATQRVAIVDVMKMLRGVFAPELDGAAELRGA
jgi:DNA-binding MarR family transcriptional regulator